MDCRVCGEKLMQPNVSQFLEDGQVIVTGTCKECEDYEATTDPFVPVFVDETMACQRKPNWPYDLACHLMTTPGHIFTLHQFANTELGLRKAWFQEAPLPHYDLTAGKRFQALKLGAVPASRDLTVRLIRMWRDYVAL